MRHDYISDALLVAHRAHAGQFRNDWKTPYIVHPLNVFQQHRRLFGIRGEMEGVAILLHDVVEDCAKGGFDFEFLSQRFPAEAIDLIRWVTKPPRPRDADKLEFNLGCYRRLGDHGPDEAIRIKVADRMDNLSDPDTWKHDFRKKYLKDTRNLVRVLGARPGVSHVSERLHELERKFAGDETSE
jgi:(p)ppGpp synthase/HD superfamily hydrolase